MATRKTTTVKPAPSKVKATGKVTNTDPTKTTAYTDGRNAAANNYPSSYCPYGPRTQQAIDWKLGHQDYLADQREAEQSTAKVGEGNYRGDY